MKKAFLYLALSLAFFSRFSSAEEDLLNILEDSNGQASSAQQITQHIKDLKMLIVDAQQGRPLTPEQNIFLDFYDKKDMKKALFQWDSAFLGSSFAQSKTGQAFYRLIVFDNGLRLSALDRLLGIPNPYEINQLILSEWSKRLPASHPLWRMVSSSSWSGDWKKIFGNEITIQVSANGSYSKENLEILRSLLNEVQPGSTEYKILLWQDIVLEQSKPTDAAKKLARLMKEKSSPISLDLMNLTAARFLYQSGYLDAAIKYYEKVDRKSQVWLEAQEEAAWAYLRKGEPQNTLALLKSVTDINFSSWSGPEALFLRSIAELKICDYKSVVISLKQFKEVFKPRLVAFQQFQSGVTIPEYNLIGDIFKLSSRVTPKDLGALAVFTPRAALRDRGYKFHIDREMMIQKESKLAEKLYFSSLAEGTSKVGFQAGMNQLKVESENLVRAAQSARNERLKLLVTKEVNEISSMLKKMQIVEAELLSQTALSSQVAAAVNQGKNLFGSTGSKDPNALTFQGTQELWFDEIGNYKVEVKGACSRVTQ